MRMEEVDVESILRWLRCFVRRGCKMEQKCKSEDLRRNESQKHEMVADETQINSQFVFVADRLQLQKSNFWTQGDLPAQTGDETEPKGPPKLAKKRPSEVEGRPKIGPRAIRELSFESKSLCFFNKTNSHQICLFLLRILLQKWSQCEGTLHQRQNTREKMLSQTKDSRKTCEKQNDKKSFDLMGIIWSLATPTLAHSVTLAIFGQKFHAGRATTRLWMASWTVYFEFLRFRSSES